VTWDFPLVGRTWWLNRCWARSGRPTTFVETPFVHPVRTLATRIARAFSRKPTTHVLRPWPPPPILTWPDIAPDRLRRAIRRRAAGFRRRLDRLISWNESAAIVVTPAWAPWLEELPFRHVIYDCIDEVSVHAPTPALFPLYEQWEQELIERATGAVTTVRLLTDHIRKLRADLPIELIPNGVDVEWFRARAQSAPPPADVSRTSRPIIGFVGALYHWIDWELIAEAARSLPEFDFVLVGPVGVEDGPDRLATLGNVRLLGPRPYQEVPAYMNAFDVCWVPFGESITSRAADPVKIYEYLSLGKPVVTTPVGDVKELGDVVSVGQSAEDIIDILREAAAAPEVDAEARVAVARANSWDARAAAYVRFVESLGGSTDGGAVSC
jgi:glycosyltransferase involved in cell wall biosynthesis